MDQRAPVVAAVLGVLALGSCGGSGENGEQSAVESSTTVAPTTMSTTTAPATTGPATTAPDEGLRTIEITLSGGQVVGGSRKETVELGERVRIRAVSDVQEVVHVHTYDAKLALSPGQPADLLLEATIPGRFEVEFEESGRDALTLEVR